MSGAAELLAFASLRDRDLAREDLVLAEGRVLAERLLAAAPRFRPLGLVCVPALAAHFEALAAGLCPVSVLPEPELAGLVGFPFHRGVLAAARRPALRGVGDLLSGECPPSRMLLLPETVDPENLGSLFRSAAALGFGAVVLGPGTADHLSRRALRVSMGAALSLEAFAAPGPEVLSELSAAGRELAASVLDPDALDLADWKPPEKLCLLVGNEYRGLGAEWLPPAVRRVTIPMAPDSDSLNAAAAAAIFMYAARGNPDSLAPRPARG